MSNSPLVPPYRKSKARCYQEVISTDPVEAPDFCLEYTEEVVPDFTIRRSEYTSAEFARLEVERMWSRTWQMACREEQIPEAGDLVVYDSPGASLIIVRTGSGEIRAFHNICRHRGMKLCTEATSVNKIACPFHNFTWSLDGDLIHVPSRWDFPDMIEADMRLTEAKVSCWAGFVFVNRDSNAQPLEKYLGHIARDFPEDFFGSRQLTAIVRKKLNGNWKSGMDAFAEVYHIAGLHPQATAVAGETSTQYDVWPDDTHVSRWIGPVGVKSDEYPIDLSEEQILALLLDARHSDELPPIPKGMKARNMLATMVRDFMGKHDGADYSKVGDSEVNDGIQYSLFPNLMLFRQLSQPWVYRFLPVRDDPNSCIFEVWVLGRKAPTDGSEPPEVEIVDLGFGQSYETVTVDMFPVYNREVLDQDVWGIERCQQGMLDSEDGDIIFARYQEKRLRHLHQTLHRYLDGSL